MNYRDTEDRYRNDPAFRRVVDIMLRMLSDMHLTPGEMRDAAMLASIHFESTRLPLAGPR